MDSKFFSKYELIQKPKRRPTELTCTVEEVIKLVGNTKPYDFAYWCAQIKKANVSFTEMLGILKQVEAAHSKYNKGALLTSILKKRWTKEKLEK